MKVFTIDAEISQFCLGYGKEIGIWDLKTMKQTQKCKFGHSEDVTSVRLNQNTLISGGEDSIINAFNIEQGLTMDSVLSTVNINQTISNINYLDKEINFVQAITTVNTYHIMNMFTGIEQFQFDAKNENYNTEYILDSYFDPETNLIQLTCGNNKGDIILIFVDINKNKVDMKYDSLIKTNFSQTFNSASKINTNNNENYYLFASDQGNIYLLDKKNELEKTIDYLNMFDEDENQIIQQKSKYLKYNDYKSNIKLLWNINKFKPY
jgi:hypothetical protein